MVKAAPASPLIWYKPRSSLPRCKYCSMGQRSAAQAQSTGLGRRLSESGDVHDRDPARLPANRPPASTRAILLGLLPNRCEVNLFPRQAGGPPVAMGGFPDRRVPLRPPFRSFPPTGAGGGRQELSWRRSNIWSRGRAGAVAPTPASVPRPGKNTPSSGRAAAISTPPHCRTPNRPAPARSSSVAQGLFDQVACDGRFGLKGHPVGPARPLSKHLILGPTPPADKDGPAARCRNFSTAT